MKSNLFNKNEMKEGSFEWEKMKRDIAVLLDIGPDKIDLFVKMVGDLLVSDLSGHEAIRKKAEQMGFTQSVLDQAGNMAGWLAAGFYRDGDAKDDNPADLVDDLLALNLIFSEQIDRSLDYVGRIKARVQELTLSDVERDLALRKYAPKIVGVDTALFFRRVFSRDAGSKKS